MSSTWTAAASSIAISLLDLELLSRGHVPAHLSASSPLTKSMAALEEDPFQQYDLDDAIGFSLDWHPTRRLLAVALVTGQLNLLNSTWR